MINDDKFFNFSVQVRILRRYFQNRWNELVEIQMEELCRIINNEKINFRTGE